MGIQDMAAALAARDKGIESSAQHAEDVPPGWQDCALSVLSDFSKFRITPFTMEEFRISSGVQHPAELRAYGALTVRAIREGIIEKTGGFAPAASSHGSPKPLYRAKGKA